MAHIIEYNPSMNELELTLNTRPPIRAPSTGRPVIGKWKEFRATLTRCKASQDWNTIKLNDGMSLVYARRIAWKMRFETGLDPDNDRLLYVRMKK